MDDESKPRLRKSRLTRLRLHEISLVDAPAQTDSVVHVWKRRAEPQPQPQPQPPRRPHPAEHLDHDRISDEAGDQLRHMTPEDRASWENSVAFIRQAQADLHKLDSTGLNAAARATKHLTKSIAEEQAERRRAAAAVDAEALFQKQAASESLARLLKAETERAEELAQRIERAGEQIEVDAALEKHRAEKRAFRRETLRRTGRTWWQMGHQNEEE